MSEDRIRELARVVVFTRAGAGAPDVGLPVVEIPAIEMSSTDIRLTFAPGCGQGRRFATSYRRSWRISSRPEGCIGAETFETFATLRDVET